MREKYAALTKRIASLDVDGLTPREALNLLAELKAQAGDMAE